MLMAPRTRQFDFDTVGDFRFEVLDLWASGRWTSALLTLGGGSRSLAIHSYYGESKANSDPIKKAESERQLWTMFTITAANGDSPVVICTDLNCEPSDSPCVAEQIERNGWVDAGLPPLGGIRQANVLKGRPLPRHDQKRWRLSS